MAPLREYPANQPSGTDLLTSTRRSGFKRPAQNRTWFRHCNPTGYQRTCGLARSGN
jgi:hypothetical protein